MEAAGCDGAMVREAAPLDKRPELAETAAWRRAGPKQRAGWRCSTASPYERARDRWIDNVNRAATAIRSVAASSATAFTYT